MDTRIVGVVLILFMVLFPIGMGLFYLLNPEGAWHFTQNRLRRSGIIATERTDAWERRRVLGGLIAIAIGIFFYFTLATQYLPLLAENVAITSMPMDGVFVTPTPLGR